MSQWIQAVLNAGTFKAWAKQLWKDAPMRARQVLLVVAVLLLLLSFCSGRALAAEPAPTTANLSWTAPTQFTDGGALAICATQTSTPAVPCLRQYRVFRGTSPTALNDSVLINDRNALGYNWTGLAPGTHHFAVAAISSAGAEGERSIVLSKLVPQPLIQAPGNFTVQPDNTTAYYVIQQENRFVLLPAGTVAPDTACDASQQVNGHSVVPREAVQWFGDVRPLAVVALCG